MTPKKFIAKYNPCSEGSAFIAQHTTLAEAWENCTRPDWMFWALENIRPLDKRQAVALAIQFARACAGYSADRRVLAAIDKTQAWLDNPSKEAEAAASAAADAAARAASVAAHAAAFAAAHAAADHAARAAAHAARVSQCDTIRQSIPNPFQS